jgi:hypothetical protein
LLAFHGQTRNVVDEFKPDVLMLDPFVELHSAEENDNTAVRAVLARLRAMAVAHDMSTAILHHARKGGGDRRGGDAGDPDSLRGASAIVGAARIVLTANIMTEGEADAFGIGEDKRRSYFRLDSAKNNYAPIEAAEWFERQEFLLPNGTDDETADGVAVVWCGRGPRRSCWRSSRQLNQRAVGHDQRWADTGRAFQSVQASRSVGRLPGDGHPRCERKTGRGNDPGVDENGPALESQVQKSRQQGGIGGVCRQYQTANAMTETGGSEPRRFPPVSAFLAPLGAQKKRIGDWR